MNNPYIEKVASFFGLGSITASRVYPKGLINITYMVDTDRGKSFVVQRLHGMFDERVISDHHAIAEYLVACGMCAPVLIRSPTGALSFRSEGYLWKVCEYIPHDPSVRPSRDSIASAAALLGKFHRITESFSYTPKYAIPDFHATPRIFAKLKKAFRDYSSQYDASEYAESYSYVTTAYDWLVTQNMHRYEENNERQQLLHGDPKFDNFLFDQGAKALIDYDTIMIGPRGLDIGDGLRSWCRKDDRVTFDREVFNAALEGYNSETVRKVLPHEALEAMSRLTLELAARFLTDCFEDCYFEWDAQRFATRPAHNLARCKELVTYHKDFSSH